jgi:hypothetical protein
MYIKFVVSRNANVNGFLRPQAQISWRAGGRLYKWIVRRNWAVRSYAKNFSKKINQILRVTSLGVVSQGNINVTIGVQSEGRHRYDWWLWRGGPPQGELPDWLVKPHRAVGGEPSHTIV